MGEKHPPNQVLFVDGIIGDCLITTFVIVFTGLDAGSAFHNLTMQDWLYLLAAGLIGKCSALLVKAAIKRAPAPLIVPSGYFEIVSAFAIGVLILNREIYALSIIACILI